MKNTLLTLLGIVILIIIMIVLAGMYKFNYLTSLPGYDVDGNKTETEDNFEIIEILGQSCQSDTDCETPMDYATRSSCPYDSVCIEDNCTVICPHPFTEISSDFVTNFLNATYSINGELVTLIDGVSETAAAPGAAAKITTRYFGNEVRVDLNEDGREDSVFLLTQETGGSGTFFYAVAALNTVDGWVGSRGFLLGDRIAPQTTEVSRNSNHKNVVVINYADRRDGEPMTVQPSQSKSVYLKLDPEALQFGEVVQNFEGEADPEVMTLGMKTWTWIRTTYNNDTELVPNDTKAFTLTFGDGTFTATTDCNFMSGTYEVENKAIAFGPTALTKMFCENSQEQEFSSMLHEVHSFFFTSKGELVFDLKFDSGSSVFR